MTKSIRDYINLTEDARTWPHGNVNPSEVDIEAAEIVSRIVALRTKILTAPHGSLTAHYNVVGMMGGGTTVFDYLINAIMDLPKHD
jgi:hypothetical protein